MVDYRKWAKKLLSPAIGFVFGIVLTAFISGISGPTIDAQPINVDFVLTLVELVALLLPALAIGLQAVLAFSRRPAIEIGGSGAEIRNVALVGTGISGFLLFLTTLIAFGRLNLPLDLQIATAFVLLSIAMFAFILLSTGIIGWTRNDIDEELSTLDAIHELSKLEEIPESERQTLISWYPDLDQIDDESPESD